MVPLPNDLFVGIVRERAEVQATFFKRSNLSLLLRETVFAGRQSSAWSKEVCRRLLDGKCGDPPAAVTRTGTRSLVLISS